MGHSWVWSECTKFLSLSNTTAEGYTHGLRLGFSLDL